LFYLTQFCSFWVLQCIIGLSLWVDNLLVSKISEYFEIYYRNALKEKEVGLFSKTA
jgi:hypothetical protein